MSKSICTIIAKNYIAFARVLCESFLEHHPDGKCYVLIIDEFDGYIDPEREDFEVVRTAELNIPKLAEFCYKYNITELATAFKPYLLKHLFDTKCIGKILYLDPDILVTNSLGNLYEALESTDIILTPHLDKDYPDDDMFPNDSHIMKSGIYNLGFIGLRNCENVNNFLNWWQHKLYDKCVIDHSNGYFVDQKFIDLATVLFPNITAIHDTGYNVAYWNIHSRAIHKKNNNWMCNDGLLYFYHFSNYKPDKPSELSGHQTRFDLKNIPQLNDLFKLYTDLLKKKDFDMAKKWPYSYAYYSNGMAIDEIDRVKYREMQSLYAIDNPFDWKSIPFRTKKEMFVRKVKRKLRQIVKDIKNKL